MLGCDLSKELAGKYDLSGIDLSENGRIEGGNFYKCDLVNEEQTAETIVKIAPGVVIHAAAMTDVDGCEKDPEKAYALNVKATGNVCLACKNINAILIYISTDFVYDGKKGSPYFENDAASPLSVYGESKLKGEDEVRETVDKFFIVRTSWLYGKNGRNFVDIIRKKAATEKELKVVDDQVGSPTYTVDLAKALRVLIDKANAKGYGVYHVSNSGSVSWYEYTKEILKLIGSETKVRPISSKELNRPAVRPAMSVLDNSKFVNFTSYRMRNWKDALREYISKNTGDDNV